MSTPTFDEVLAGAQRLSIEDQIRLRAGLPITSMGQEPPSTESGAGDTHPFRFLAGLIDEEPRSNLSADDREIYGQ